MAEVSASRTDSSASRLDIGKSPERTFCLHHPQSIAVNVAVKNMLAIGTNSEENSISAFFTADMLRPSVTPCRHFDDDEAALA